MQGEVVRLKPHAASQDAPSGPRPDAAAPSSVRAYILDMVEQLSRLAADQGEPVLAAMLREVSRRQHVANSQTSA